MWGKAAVKRAVAAVVVTAEATSAVASAAGKSAMSAYERAKNVLPERLTEESALRLVAAVDSVCIDAQFFGAWHASLLLSPQPKDRGGAAKEAAVKRLRASLEGTGAFLDGVLVELLLRDLETLLDLYMTRVTRTDEPCAKRTPCALVRA